MATRSDIPLVLSFIRELAEYERAPNAVHCTEADLERYGFGPNPIFHAIIAEWGKSPAGMALYYYYYSTWAGHPGIFLEDLYVRPEFRRKNVGVKLMVYLAKTALKEECYAVRWQVLNWNKSAIEFYAQLGSEFLKEWDTLQITGQNLKQLAEVEERV